MLLFPSSLGHFPLFSAIQLLRWSRTAGIEIFICAPSTCNSRHSRQLTEILLIVHLFFFLSRHFLWKIPYTCIKAVLHTPKQEPPSKQTLCIHPIHCSWQNSFFPSFLSAALSKPTPCKPTNRKRWWWERSWRSKQWRRVMRRKRQLYPLFYSRRHTLPPHHRSQHRLS